MATAATGDGWVVISSDNTTVTYFVTYSGLSGALAAAHIHTGAAGVAGGVILPLAAGPSPMFGTLTSADFKPSGSVTTFAEALAAIRGGMTYFNLHTAANPGGEIRGNLTGTAVAFEATIDGAQEVPTVATVGTGDGLAVIRSDGTSVGYAVTYSGLSGALAAAHIHTGAAGVAGGVILPLAAGPSPMFGTLTSADFKPSGSVTTFAEALAAIRGGTTYFNLHTAANPGGEIRGQIVAAAAPTPTGTPPATSTEISDRFERRRIRSAGSHRPLHRRGGRRLRRRPAALVAPDPLDRTAAASRAAKGRALGPAPSSRVAATQQPAPGVTIDTPCGHRASWLWAEEASRWSRTCRCWTTSWSG